jgi:outer membrane protein assembly factor BamD
VRTLLVALLLLTAAQAHARKDRDGETPAEAYERGLRLLRNGYTERALDQFQRIRNTHRDDPISLKAQLAIADTYFKKGDFDVARQEYEEFASYHPRHEDMHFVTWRIGQCIWKDAPKFAGRDQTATRSAVNAWTGFASRYPESRYLEEVEEHLSKGRTRLASKEIFIARFYARRDAWGAVRGRAEGVLARYADTDRAPAASLLLGTALHAWGEPDAASAELERLRAAHPDSTAARALGRVLARPPGTRPEEPVFLRPYRVQLPQVPGA